MGEHRQDNLDLSAHDDPPPPSVPYTKSIVSIGRQAPQGLQPLGEVSAIGGWSIEATRSILETYVPRTTEMAREAVRKCEQRNNRV